MRLFSNGQGLLSEFTAYIHRAGALVTRGVLEITA